MRLHVVDHPLVAHKLTALRDRDTDSPTFRRLADELVTLLAYEATRGVRIEEHDILTRWRCRSPASRYSSRSCSRTCGWPTPPRTCWRSTRSVMRSRSSPRSATGRAD